MAQLAWMPYFTFGIALLGAVLGVINLWRAISRDRIKLRVIPVWGHVEMNVLLDEYVEGYSEFRNILDHDPYGVFGVRVVNTGFVEVTIASLGFTHCRFVERHRPSAFRRVAIKASNLSPGIKFPLTLKPRTSVTMYAGRLTGDLAASLAKTTRVYASTDCGLLFFSNSGLLREVVRRARLISGTGSAEPDPSA